MRTITMNAREARLLRDNLTTNTVGYDFLDLKRLDHLAGKLTELQGEYATRMAELAREEKAIHRSFLRKQTDEVTANQQLRLLALDVEEANEAAEGVELELHVEDGDYRLIADKVSAVSQWQANDEIRHVIIGMVEAVQSAAGEESATVTPMRKRG